MKNSMGTLGNILILVFISSFFDVSANEKKLEFKCHVELLGGRDSIYFTNVKQNQIKKLKVSLVGKKFKAFGVKGKQTIYKVNECKPINDIFDSTAAKSADSLILR